MSLRNPQIKGRCSACRNATLFLGDGGHITCSWFECPNPAAAGMLLDGIQGILEFDSFVIDLDALVTTFEKIANG